MSTSEIHNLHGQRQFFPSGPGREEPPQEHPKHKPGVKATPEDNAPEFEAKPVPPGTAPKENLFQPQTTETTPGQGMNEQVLRGHGKESTHTAASSTLGGATSQDVNTGMGQPMPGQTSKEMRHEGEKHRKHPGAGLEGVGASTKASNVEASRLEGEHRYLQEERAQQKGINAEDRTPESAESVAAERQHHGGKPTTT